jgi:ribose transport system ATP-binding protein
MNEPKNKNLLEMHHITKRFPGVLALDDVDFTLKHGEVHVLMGANGAGKSTLMEVLSGTYSKDGGTILIDGKKVDIHNSKDAQNHGIAIIHQHFSQVPHLSVAENIFLGRERISHGLIDYKKLYKDTQIAIDRVGLEVNIEEKVMNLSVSQRQMIEISKALSFDSRLFIMDEPTSALTKNETKKLFELIRKLTNKGIGVIYISHRIDELSAIGNRVTVMKDGKIVGTRNIEEIEMSELVHMMVGKQVNYVNRKNNDAIDFSNRENLFEVKNLSVKTSGLKNINLHIKPGEILGLYGLMGAGRTELAKAIFGIDKIDEGELLVRGEVKHINSPSDAVASGIGFLTEDRLKTGLALKLSVGENISLPNLKKFLTKVHTLNLAKEKDVVDEMITKLNIKTPNAKVKVKNLSGGNQQKVVFAKWILANSCLLILDDPTQGIDVGAIEEVHKVILDYTKRQDNGVLLISSEINEIMQLSDRIMIIHDGEIVSEVDGRTATKETVMEIAFSGKTKVRGE